MEMETNAHHHDECVIVRNTHMHAHIVCVKVIMGREIEDKEGEGRWERQRALRQRVQSDNCVESGGLQSGSCTCSKFTQYNVCVSVYTLFMGFLLFTFDYNLFGLTVE